MNKKNFLPVKHTLIIVILLAVLVISGCATTPEKKLMQRCLEYKETGRLSENSVHLTDRFIWSLEGIITGYFTGGILGWSLIVVDPKYESAAKTLCIASMAAGAVSGFILPSFNNFHINETYLENACRHYNETGEIIPYYTKKKNYFPNILSAGLGSVAGGLASVFIYLNRINQSQDWSEFQKLFVFSVLSGIGYTIGWNMPDIIAGNNAEPGELTEP